MFVARSRLTPKWLARLRGVLSEPGVIGRAEELKSELSKIFPEANWRIQALPFRLPGVAAGSEPWVSYGPPELQLFSETTGCVRHLFAGRIELREIRLVEKRL